MDKSQRLKSLDALRGADTIFSLFPYRKNTFLKV